MADGTDWNQRSSHQVAVAQVQAPAIRLTQESIQPCSRPEKQEAPRQCHNGKSVQLRRPLRHPQWGSHLTETDKSGRALRRGAGPVDRVVQFEQRAVQPLKLHAGNLCLRLLRPAGLLS